MAHAQRYVALFDILGFSNLVEARRLDDVIAVFSELRRSMESSRTFIADLRSENLISYTLFSDTVVAHTRDDSVAALGDLVRFSQLLIGIAFHQRLLLRGAMTKGEVFVDEHLLIGRPIVQAYRMEQEQEWVGCWVEDECMATLAAEHQAAAVDRLQVLHYPIPLKTGTVKERWALNWAWPVSLWLNEEDSDQKVDAAFADPLKPEVVSWAAARKRDNTKHFLRHALAKISSLSG